MGTAGGSIPPASPNPAIPAGRMEGEKVRQDKRKRREPSAPRPVRIYPLPEAVSGGRTWAVREAGTNETPHVDLGTYAMAIPTEDDPVAAWVRLHEMAHARWTPVNAHKTAAAEALTPMSLNACEDARIHRKLRDADFPIGKALRAEDEQRIAEHFAAGGMEALDAARFLMAAIGTGDEPFVRDQVRSIEGGRAIEEVVRDVWRTCFGKRRPAFPKTIEAAKALDDWFGEPPDTEVLADLEKVLHRLPDRPDTGRRAPGEAVWGTMKIEKVPLPLRLPSRIRNRTRRCIPEGAVPRNWHRLPIDGAVFTKKTKRLAGGVVLIDQSGSMHFTPDDVLTILLAAPAAVVATYAGHSASGVLRILAAGGKRCKDEDVHLTMDNNTVDGPALEWIGGLPGPRFWVSDGLATSPGGDAIRSAVRIAMKHSIRRVDDVAGLMEALDEHR